MSKHLRELAVRCAKEANSHNDNKWHDEAEKIAHDAVCTALAEIYVDMGHMQKALNASLKALRCCTSHAKTEKGIDDALADIGLVQTCLEICRHYREK